MKKKAQMCSCGSGRPADRCCRARTLRIVRTVIVFTLIVAASTAIAALQANPPEATDVQVRTPEPWEYDAATNRHWHAPHGHWHDGPPPPLSQRGGTTGTTGLSTGISSANTVPPPVGRTPEPWEYDEVNDRHWHAPHGHYHPGPPPPPDQRN